jgi:hypothetical protein
VKTGIQEQLLEKKYGFLLEFTPYLIRGRNDKKRQNGKKDVPISVNLK